MRSILIFTFFFTAATVFAQQTITGTVQGVDDQQPLIGAHVYLLSDWSKGAITDIEGAFSITVEEVKPADSLLVSFIGYEELVVAVMQLQKESVIALVPSQQMIDAVVVSAENLIAEEFSIKKISKLEIYKNPSSKADALLAVNSLASATTLDETANVSFRGSSPAETGVFLNQVPVYDFVRFSQLNGLGTLSFFNTDLLKSVQVFPGNPPLEFGNTSSGLIAMQTEDGIPEENQQQLALTLASSGGSIRQRVNERQGITIYGNYQSSGLFRNLNQTALKDILKFNSVDLGLHYVNQLQDRTQLKLFNYTLIEGYDFNFTSPTFNGLFRQRKRRNLSIGNLTHKLERATLALNSGFSYSTIDFDFSNTDIAIRNRDLFLGGNYQYEGRKLGIKAGVAFDSRHSDFEGMISTYGYAFGPEHPVSFSQANNRREVLDAYVYLKRDISDRLVIGSALRKNIPLRGQKSFWSRQTNVNYQINDRWGVKAAYGSFHKFVLPQSIDPSTLLVKTTQASIDVQRKRGSNLLAISIFTKDSQLEDREIITHGLEVSIDSKIGSKFSYNASYTFIDATVKTEEITYAGNFDMNYFIKGGLEWAFLEHWTLGSRWIFRPGTRYQPVIAATFDDNLDAFEPQYAGLDAREHLTPYRLIDLNVSRLFPISEDLTIIAFGNVSNVVDFQNVREIAYNRDYTATTDQLFNRRTIYFGVIFNFL